MNRPDPNVTVYFSEKIEDSLFSYPLNLPIELFTRLDGSLHDDTGRVVNSLSAEGKHSGVPLLLCVSNARIDLALPLRQPGVDELAVEEGRASGSGGQEP